MDPSKQLLGLWLQDSLYILKLIHHPAITEKQAGPTRTKAQHNAFVHLEREGTHLIKQKDTIELSKLIHSIPFSLSNGHATLGNISYRAAITSLIKEASRTHLPCLQPLLQVGFSRGFLEESGTYPSALSIIQDQRGAEGINFALKILIQMNLPKALDKLAILKHILIQEEETRFIIDPLIDDTIVQHFRRRIFDLALKNDDPALLSVVMGQIWPTISDDEFSILYRTLGLKKPQILSFLFTHPDISSLPDEDIQFLLFDLLCEALQNRSFSCIPGLLSHDHLSMDDLYEIPDIIVQLVRGNDVKSISLLFQKFPTFEEQLSMALCEAVWTANIPIIKLLLSHPQIDPSQQNSKALCLAAMRGKVEVVELLIDDKRSDVTALNDYPLLIACEKGYLKVVHYLLENELTKHLVNPQAHDNHALRMSAQNGFYGIMVMLLKDSRVDVNSQDGYAWRNTKEPIMRSELSKHPKFDHSIDFQKSWSRQICLALKRETQEKLSRKVANVLTTSPLLPGKNYVMLSWLHRSFKNVVK